VRALAVSIALVAISGCILKTDLVSSAFNGGALDSSGDPFRVPSDLAASRVERIVEQEMSDGYFLQGPGGDVGKWMSQTAEDCADFVTIVSTINVSGDVATKASRAKDARSRSDALVAKVIKEHPPICNEKESKSTLDHRALELFLDEMRFKEAMWRAANRVASLALEGIVSDKAIQDGAHEAFSRAGAYIGQRHWKRRENLKAPALAVEGGAASGIFAAGAVWVVLHLIDGWMTACPAGSDCDVRFRLVSGTSTGAMIAVAVDRFNSMQTHEERDKEINNVAKWFTCYSFSDLMCVQSMGMQHLLGMGSPRIRGALQFDGIQKVLTSCVKPWMLDNVSELILNTTELRTGRIFALSDQNEMRSPSTVVHAALASGLLPIIGEPDKEVWDGLRFDPKYDASRPYQTEPAYLDGGLRSELPVLPLVRRGAERVLTVASGASIVAENKRLETVTDIAARYINVNTGAVMETELEYSRRVAESARQCEIESCMEALDGDGSRLCDPDVHDGACNRWNVCHGNYAEACTPLTQQMLDALRKEHDQQTLAQRLEPFWKMESIFVDRTNVDDLSGYDFRPSELRRLFRAGAEAARVRCLDIARLLGILPEHEQPTQKQLAQVNQWCAARMADDKTTCADATGQNKDFVMRACGTKLPNYLDSCAGESDRAP
jgi:predicted acylesterase/phospholipase RssA